MDPNALPFDADAMLDGLRTWVECESPTFDAAAVNRMMDIASRELVIAGARIERVAGRMGFGDCVRASFPHATPNVPGILVMGHLDTVHPIGTLAKLPFRRDGSRAWGPGIQDMKGGNYMALEAIRQLAARRRGHAAAGHRAAHQRRGGRQPIDPRPDRGGGVAPPLRAGAGTGACRWRRGDRPLRHRALQPGGHRPPEPCRRPAGRRPLGDPRDGAQADRDRGHDHRGLHLLGRRHPWRAVGELRHHHLHRRGAVDGQAAGGPRPRRRAHAGAVGLVQRRAVQGDARRHAAGVGAGRAG